MSKSISSEGQRIIEILSEFPEFSAISKASEKDVNQEVNSAMKKLRKMTDEKAHTAVSRIESLAQEKRFREAEKRGCFIGFDPSFD